MLEIFSAIFMASMAAFSKETVFSRPFGGWDLRPWSKVKVTTRKRCEVQDVRNEWDPNRDER